MNNIEKLRELQKSIIELKNNENNYNEELKVIGKDINGISIKDYIISNIIVEDNNKDVMTSLIEEDILEFIKLANKEYYATRLTNKNFADKLFEEKIVNSHDEFVYLSLIFSKDNLLNSLYEDKREDMINIVDKYVSKDRVFNMIFKNRV